MSYFERTSVLAAKEQLVKNKITLQAIEIARHSFTVTPVIRNTP